MRTTLTWSTQLLLLISVTSEDHNFDQLESERWNRDVYTGRHFDDLVLKAATRGIIQHPALLLFYNSACDDDLEHLGIGLAHLPPQTHVIFARYHNIETTKHIPFTLMGKDDLRYRYRTDTCPTVFYFARGSDINRPLVWKRNKGDFVEWVWEKMRVTILVQNLYYTSVLVKFAGPGPEVDLAYIDPGETQEVETYVSYFATVIGLSNDGEQQVFLHGTVVTQGQNIVLDIGQLQLGLDIAVEEWIQTKEKEVWTEEEMILRRQYQLAEMYIRGFKQLTLLPQLTATGFEKWTLPEPLKVNLVDYYNANEQNKIAPDKPMWPVINDDEKPLFVVSLSPSFSEEVNPLILEQTRNFCDCQPIVSDEDLVIMEFQKFGVVRTRVTNPTNCIFTAILVLELSEAKSWQFTLYNKEGKRQVIFLKTGDIVVVESASLIHGLPVPLERGRALVMFVNLYTEEGWTWYDDWIGEAREFHYLIQGHHQEIMEPLFVLETKAGATSGHVHGEL